MGDYLSKHSGLFIDEAIDKIGKNVNLENGATNLSEGLNVATAEIANLEGEIRKNILNIELDPEGNLNAIYGGDSSAFKNGYTDNDGNIILEFEYQ